MSEFKPLRSLSIKAYAAAKGLASLELFSSKDGESRYAAQKDSPHIPVCFVSTKINTLADVRAGAMVSTFVNAEGQEYDVLHNAGNKESLGSLL